MIFSRKLLRIYKTSKLLLNFDHVCVSAQKQSFSDKEITPIVDCFYLSRRHQLLCSSLPKAVRIDTFESNRQYSTVITQNLVAAKKKMGKLTEQERSELLRPLLDAGWSMVSGRDAIEKEYLFKDFNAAFCFMTSLAMIAEQMNHHPEWFNVYNKLRITLSTHDVGGLSVKDIKMAKYMEERYKCL